MNISNSPESEGQVPTEPGERGDAPAAALGGLQAKDRQADQELKSAAFEPHFSENAMTVLRNRYLARDAGGKVTETPKELLRRVAGAVSASEKAWGASSAERTQIEEEFYRLMASKAFLPNSPTLMNAGRPLGMLSACFVLPLGDSIPEIMETARQIALVQRAGGGTGIDFSELRPKGSTIRSSGGATDGPLSFLKMLSAVTEAIQQGAFRHGANMGVMRVDHPDILSFIDIKSDHAQLTNYNLSVAVTNDFMESLTATPNAPHVVLRPHSGQRGLLSKATGMADYAATASCTNGTYYTVRDVWERIVRRAWQSGDPGLIFIDEVNARSQTPRLGPIRSTNPCGEQPLLPYEACNLGSINLAAFHRQGASGPPDQQIDWQRLKETVRLAVRFLDNVIDANKYPTPEIHRATHATRKIGLGVMGFADLLFKLAVPYDSDDALRLADRVGSFIRETGWAAGERLAETRGKFPAWDGSVWETEFGGRPMRNAHVTTIAPTGTISIIAGCSSGIEPVFSLVFTRQVLGGKKLVEINPVFADALRDHVSQEKELQQIAQHAGAQGSIQDVSELPEEVKRVFCTARDISPSWHVRMQAAWQRHTDAAVSKTVNLPQDASAQSVEEAFLLAYELKCKGITVYRDGARELQPMALVDEERRHAEQKENAGPAQPIRLPEVIPSVRLRQPTPFGNMHLHISVEPETGCDREIFAQLGKGGDLANSDLEAICRLISLLLRVGGSLTTIIDQLDGIGSSLSVPSRDGQVKSLADGLARALRKYMSAKRRLGLDSLLSGRVRTLGASDVGNVPASDCNQETLFKIKCPDCDLSGTLAFEEGCLKCHGCGFSMC